MKNRFTFETKYKVVQEYLSGKTSIRNSAKYLNCNESTIRQWVSIYQSKGSDGLHCSHTKKQWDNKIKIVAITEYLSKQGSLWDICKKYKISHHNILKRWIKMYNDGHKELETTGSGGRKPMTKGRKTTFDERLEIVHFCIENGKNYGITLNKYDVSYQQIYLWVKKYTEKGIEGLIDRRGKEKSESELSEVDRLNAKNKMLEAEKRELEMEINLLKKLQEVERRRR